MPVWALLYPSVVPVQATHTHKHVPPSNTHTSRGTRAAADMWEFVATELVGTERGGGNKEAYIKAVCFPAVFLSFSPYRLCPSIAAGVVFGFLHVALFLQSFFCFSISLHRRRAKGGVWSIFLFHSFE